jgi:hypothetical protein
MANELHHFVLLDSSAGTHIQYGEYRIKPRKENIKRLKTYSSREIIKQLGIILSHPTDLVQEENLHGLFPNYILERYENQGKEILLACNRNKYYLRRWYLSRILTFGNIGNDEKILATICFNGYSPMERLFQIIIQRIIKRNVFLLAEAYELCRSLYPLIFPRLPDVKDSNSNPRFALIVRTKQTRKKNQSSRIRNPSAVGGKHGQGITPLPLEPMSGGGPSNVDELFLETYKLISTR